MPIQSIEPRRLYRQIADQIRTLIGSGQYPLGARLPPERDLARQLGVSRPSVREALIALEVEGLVEVRIGDAHRLELGNKQAAEILLLLGGRAGWGARVRLGVDHDIAQQALGDGVFEFERRSQHVDRGKMRERISEAL